MNNPVKILIFALFVSLAVGLGADVFVDRILGQKNNPAAFGTQKGQYSEIVRVPRHQDGHYWVELMVNDRPVAFVVDTGASHISLSFEDAERVGLNPEYLDYNHTYRTAAGLSKKALVRLDEIRLGPIQVDQIQASISQKGDLPVSLLGMNFLSALKSFSFEDNMLLLVP